MSDGKNIITKSTLTESGRWNSDDSRLRRFNNGNRPCAHRFQGRHADARRFGCGGGGTVRVKKNGRHFLSASCVIVIGIVLSTHTRLGYRDHNYGGQNSCFAPPAYHYRGTLSTPHQRRSKYFPRR